MDFSDIVQNLHTNITTVRLIDPTKPLVEHIVKNLNGIQKTMNLSMAPLQANKLTVNAMLIYDAVNVYARALNGTGKINKIMAEPLQCMNSPFTSWTNGYKLINYMRVVSIPFWYIIL